MYNRRLFSHKKVGTPAIYANMDGLWGHYAQWNKSDRERQIQYNLILYEEPKSIELIETE